MFPRPRSPNDHRNLSHPRCIIEHVFDNTRSGRLLETSVLETFGWEPAEQMMSDAEISELIRTSNADPTAWSDPDSSRLDPSTPTEMLGLAWWMTDLERMTGPEKVDALRARVRVIAHHQARLLETVAALVGEYEDLDDDVADAPRRGSRRGAGCVGVLTACGRGRRPSGVATQ